MLSEQDRRANEDALARSLERTMKELTKVREERDAAKEELKKLKTKKKTTPKRWKPPVFNLEKLYNPSRLKPAIYHSNACDSQDGGCICSVKQKMLKILNIGAVLKRPEWKGSKVTTGKYKGRDCNFIEHPSGAVARIYLQETPK